MGNLWYGLSYVVLQTIKFIFTLTMYKNIDTMILCNKINNFLIILIALFNCEIGF